uniref:Uncharacterized protein n=1 Tax=Anguilla anguilla TaxID=7936 RepID=A0A0E9W9V3_ANGAN
MASSKFLGWWNWFQPLSSVNSACSRRISSMVGSALNENRCGGFRPFCGGQVSWPPCFVSAPLGVPLANLDGAVTMPHKSSISSLLTAISENDVKLAKNLLHDNLVFPQETMPVCTRR